MNPAISVIMPVYNTEKYLRECLDSVINQTFKDIEIICVDDGSTDSSPAILAEYAAKDKRIKIITREHSNAGACRNVGMDVASGDFLSFLDSDDVFAPKMLEILHDAIIRSNADVAICKSVFYYDGEELPRLDGRVGKGGVDRLAVQSGKVDVFQWAGRAWDKLFRAEPVRKAELRFQEIRHSNDTLFTYSALSLLETIANIDSRLIAHRINAASLESTRSKNALSIVEALEAYRRNMTETGTFKKLPYLRDCFLRYVVIVMFWSIDTIDAAEAYESIFVAFKDICKRWDLHSLKAEAFSDEPGLFRRLEMVLNGCHPLDVSHDNELRLQRKLHEAYNYQRMVGESPDFKLGHVLLKIPRFFKRCFEKLQRA